MKPRLVDFIKALVVILLINAISLIQTAQEFDKTILSRLNVNLVTNDAWLQELNNSGIYTQPKNFSVIKKLYKNIPLFKQYPQLSKKIPYISIGNLPTPIEKIEKFSSEFGISFYVKRDDLTGLQKANGEMEYGGNKVRKLEFLLAEGMLHGADTFGGFGAAGSNFAVALSIYSKILGKKCFCMLKPQTNSHVVRQNLLLHLKNGTDLHYYLENTFRKLATISFWWDVKQKTGKYPYLIPIGGSNALGSLGFVNAAFELKEQIAAGLIPEPDKIYIACGNIGTSGTSVGLMLGCKLANLKTKIILVGVDPEDEKGDYAKAIAKLYHETNYLLHSKDSSIPILPLPNDLEINLNFCGPRYGVITPEGANAKKSMKKVYNLNLEGTYTSKCLAALFSDIDNKKIKSAEVIIFWNSYFGFDLPKTLNNLDYKKLPHCFHEYFETDVQPLDRN